MELAFFRHRHRIQKTWVSFRAKLICPSRVRYVSETINLSEHRPSLQRQASVPPRDSRLDAQIDAILAARHSDPFALLGPHLVDGNWTVRFFLPWAANACISLTPQAIEGGTLVPAKVIDAVKLRPEGFFEATWPSQQSATPASGSYKIQGRTHSGDPFEIFDPYAFPIVLSEFDLYLMGEGRHYDTYEKLGAHVITLEGVRVFTSPCGHPAPSASALWAISMAGTAASIPCALEGPPAYGKSFCPSSTKAPSTNMKSSARAAILSLLKRIPMLFAPSCVPIPALSSRASITTNGMTPIGWQAARRKTGLNQRSPSTKSISVPGAGSPKIMIAGLAIENSATS